MLYDVLPPLLFFASLGGIILVVSRVVLRMKRFELAQAIQVEGSASRSAHQILNPKESRIRLMRSRLTAAGVSVRESVSSLKSLPARVRAARRKSSEPRPASAGREPGPKTIQAPHSSWRERVSGTYHGLSDHLRRTISRSQRATPVTQPEKSPAPKIQLRRVEGKPTPPASTPRVETTAQRFQALVRKQRATTSPVVEAQAALAAGNLSAAEDILVSYLAKHPKNTVAYFLLGEIAARRETWDEAVEILEQVIRLDANTPGAYEKLGVAALHAGRFTRALEALQRAHDLEPENVNVLKHLLKIAQRMDNRVLQKSVLEKLIVAAPDDTDVHLAAEAAEERERNHTQPA